MNKRILALALAGALSLSMLTACGGQTDPAPETTAPVVESPSAAPETETPAPETETPVAEETPEAPETETPDQEEPSDTPSAKPSTKPSAPPASSQPSAQPSPTPAVEPETPAPQVDVVQAIWNEIAKQELPSAMDGDAAILSQFYGIDAGDLESYVLKIPMMAVHATEFFIAEVKDGKMDAVKAGVEKRQADLVAQWSQYLPDQLELVENYKLVTSGNYILFAVSEHADAAVSAFNTYAK